MKRWIAAACVVYLSLLFPFRAGAQSAPISADRHSVEMLGTLGKGSISSSLRLTASDDVVQITLLISDLVDAATTGLVRDPIPASAITLSPGYELPALAKGQSVQVALQVAPPGEAGTWSGTLSVHWQEPSPGGLVLPVTLTVRNDPVLTVVEPAAMKVASTRGRSESRTLVLRETANGVPITGLKAIIQDLLSAKGDAVLPGNRVHVQFPSTELEGGGWVTATVFIDLDGVPSGQYAGNLLIADDHGNQVSVPLTVSVKDRPLVPIVALLLGVALSMGITHYRSRGRYRDRLALQIANIRDQVKQETRFQEVLAEATERILVEAEAAQTDGQWDQANAAIQRAKRLIVLWRQDRAEWVQQIEHMQGLRKRLQAYQTKPRLIEDLDEQLDKIELEDKSAELLQDTLAQAERALNDFEKMSDRLDRMQDALSKADLPPEPSRRWETQLQDLSQRLENLPLGKDETAQALATDIQTQSRELREKIEQHRESEAKKQALLGQSRAIVDDLAEPKSPLISLAKAADKALNRLEQEPDRAQASTWAENIWRGLWSAQNILLRFAANAPKPIAEAVKSMEEWLSDGNSYLQPADSFNATLQEREAKLRTVLSDAAVDFDWPIRPPVLPGAVPKGILSDLEALDNPIGVKMPPSPAEGSAGPGETLLERSGCVARLLELALVSPRAGVQNTTNAARWRLNLFTAATYIIALGFLAWIGFNELYASSAAFGSNVAADYFALLAWGFGVEATRSAVADWVTALVPSD